MILLIGLGIALLCMAIFWSIAFYLAKCLASVFAVLSNQWLRFNPASASLRLTSWACALLVLLLVPMKGCSYMQVEQYRQAIPDLFEPVKIVHHDDVSGFREGCGFAIFQLSDDNVRRIRSHGLAYLETARVGRGGKPYHEYKPWGTTPPSGNEQLFRGASCVDKPPELLKQARRAAEKDGAFFTTGHEQDLVIVPTLGILVYSYNG